MDSKGIPLSYNLFPGNESKKTYLRPIVKRTKSKFGIDKVIVDVGRGLNTPDNTFFYPVRMMMTTMNTMVMFIDNL